MMPLPTRLKKPPKFTVIEAMTKRGYVFVDGGHPYAADFYPPGTTRQEVKDRSKQPVLRLTLSDMQSINEWAQSEDDCITAALSIHDTGALPDPMQARVELAMAKQAEKFEARIRMLEEELANAQKAAAGKLAAQREAELVAEGELEKKEAELIEAKRKIAEEAAAAAPTAKKSK